MASVDLQWINDNAREEHSTGFVDHEEHDVRTLYSYYSEYWGANLYWIVRTVYCVMSDGYIEPEVTDVTEDQAIAFLDLPATIYPDM